MMRAWVGASLLAAQGLAGAAAIDVTIWRHETGALRLWRRRHP